MQWSILAWFESGFFSSRVFWAAQIFEFCRSVCTVETERHFSGVAFGLCRETKNRFELRRLCSCLSAAVFQNPQSFETLYIFQLTQQYVISLSTVPRMRWSFCLVKWETNTCQLATKAQRQTDTHTHTHTHTNVQTWRQNIQSRTAAWEAVGQRDHSLPLVGGVAIIARKQENLFNFHLVVNQIFCARTRRIWNDGSANI